MKQQERIKEREKKIKPELAKELGKKNIMAVPKLRKVVVSTGTGSTAQREKKRQELILDRFTKITGQKPLKKGAKKSIASFKTRIGDVIGMTVTLRGDRMYGFLDKLFGVAIPRIRDFRGIEQNVVDEMGNMTIGIKEHTVFPETADEDLKDVFGLAVTIVTTAKTKQDALAFFHAIGVPLKK